MKRIYIIFVLSLINYYLHGQTITQEIGKISLMKYDYFRDKDNSVISFTNYRIYTFPDSANSEYKLIISTIEPKKVEVGSSSGASTSGIVGSSLLGIGLSFNTFYASQVLTGVCEIEDIEIQKVISKFNSVLSTTGAYKVALNKSRPSSVLITENYQNLTFGSEIKPEGINYYFKIDKATFILSENEFMQIAKFIAKVKSGR